MVDTLKFLIPIDDFHVREKILSSFDRFRKESLKTGKVEFEFHSNNLKLGSYQRTVSIKSTNEPMGLFVEFSIPKYEKGNNIEMTHPQHLPFIMENLYQELCVVLNYKLPHFSNWQLYRVDLCYNWLFKTVEETRHAMNFIQRIDYPRKQKYVYDTSVMYKGSSYTIKFYLKGPEFRKHDLSSIEYNTAMLLTPTANRILRFEISFKKAYLKSLFEKDKVYLEDIVDPIKIESILSRFLTKKVFCYITTETMTKEEVEKKIYDNFSKTKATNLYLFYKGYYFDEAVKARILSGGMHRSTIYRYKKDLKSIGVGFEASEIGGENILEQLVIPSQNSQFEFIERRLANVYYS